MRSLAAGSSSSAVEYGPGSEGDAQDVASPLGIAPPTGAAAAVAPGHVQVVLGRGYELPDTSWQAESPTAGRTLAATPTPTPDSGKPIDASCGIPA
ncbi:MAG: hypothetical protein JO152_13800 [Mycobacteriaceae bacterium]|nr:hypothetical protein [Mycobacteriaceae bacterium]